MKRLIIVLIASLTVLSCNDEVEQKTLDVEKFIIIIPSTWNLEELQGYDSFVRQIRINGQEKISIDLGWYSSNLNVDNSTHDITNKTIDNKSAKIVKPKNFQQGTTGVYFDSIDIQKTKLQMSGVNLSAGNQRLFLTAIETLKFK
jgi:hypothetical protein